MKKGKKLIIIGALGVCVLAAGGILAYKLIFSGDKLEAPADYALGGDSVESLSAAVGEENSGKLTEMTTPETAVSDAPGDEDSAPARAVDEICFYTYEKLDTGGATVQQYVEKLTGEEDGFQIVDSTDTVTEAPDYTQAEGSVTLARAASEDGKILRMEIAWTAADCQITLTRPEGEVSEAGAEDDGAIEALTNSDAVNLLKAMPPEKLGIQGDSMENYDIYPIEGAVMVDGNLCLRLQVYPAHGEDESSAIAGTYFLSGDQKHLYRLDGEQVSELPM